MKSLFPSYYPLDEQELNELWENATFVFDTNVLIDLLRLNLSSATNILDTLDKIKDKIFIPHQVALEFQRNYPKVISLHTQTYNDLSKLINETFANLSNKINEKNLGSRHADIDPNELKTEIDKYRSNLIEKINSTQKKSQFEHSSTSIINTINRIIEGRIGQEFEKKEFEEAQKEAQRRITNQIPPGYKDKPKEKEGDNSSHFFFNEKKYIKSHGDFFYWKQSIEHCKKERINHLILVTNENKEDWWEKGEDNKKIGPRRELREEIINSGVTHFHIYTQQLFLKEVSRRKIQSVKKGTIDDINSLDNGIKNIINKKLEKCDNSIDRHNLEIMKEYSLYFESQSPQESVSTHIKSMENKAELLNEQVARLYHEIDLSAFSSDISRPYNEIMSDIYKVNQNLKLLSDEIITMRELSARLLPKQDY